MKLIISALTVLTWGGVYEDAQRAAWFAPFEAAYGIEVVSIVPGDSGLAKLRAEKESGNLTVDIADLAGASVIQGCEEGLLEPLEGHLDFANYDSTTVQECGIAHNKSSVVLATTKDSAIQSVEDFFNPEIEGRRAIKKQPRFALEFALAAAGESEIYETLQDSSELAFSQLEKIRHQIVWYESNHQGAQLLVDGEVDASLVFSGRVAYFQDEGATGLKIHWDEFHLEMYSWFGIPKAVPNKDIAVEFLKFATGPRNVDFAKYINYLPAHEEKEKRASAFIDDGEFWANHGEVLQTKFFSWL